MLIILKLDFEFDIIRHDKNQSYLFLKSRGGIYALNDADGKHLYIGKTADLYNRLVSHFSGNTHTKRLYKNFHSFSVVYEDNEDLRIIGELLLISKLKPIINASVKGGINHNLPLNKISYDGHTKCKGTTLEGKKCRMIAHLNGYCRYHGGDGMTKSRYVKQASEIAAEEYLNKK